MIFTLVTAVQEKLNHIVDVIKNRRDEEKRQKEKEAEEAEKVETGNVHHTYMWCTHMTEQAGFVEGRGTRDQIANIGNMEKALEFIFSVYMCSID